MEESIYELFSLDPNASVKEIKKSYVGLIRKDNLSKTNVKVFTFLTQAKDTLCDPTTREIYDSLQRIKELLDIYSKEASNLNWANAVKILKQISIEKPEEGEIQKLFKAFPPLAYTFNVHDFKCRTEDYYIEGQIYRHQANILTGEDRNHSNLAQLARESFKKSIARNSSNSKPYLAIAQTYLKEKAYSEATDWARQAINADGKTDFEDFEALHFLCLIYANSGELQRIEVQVQEISELIPSREARNQAFLKFIASGEELYRNASELSKKSSFSDQFNLFEASLAFKRAAKVFNPSDEETENQCNKLENLVKAIEQLKNIEEDALFSENFRKLVALSLYDSVSCNVFGNEEDLLSSVIEELVSSFEPSEIAALIERLKFQYSKIYGLNKKVFDRLSTAAQEPRKQKVKVNISLSELSDGVNYQDFLKTLRNTYFHQSNTLKEGIDYTTDRLSTVLEPIAERIIENYKISQLDGSEYQMFFETIRSRSTQDTVLLRKGSTHVSRKLYNFLNPIAEQLIFMCSDLEDLMASLIGKITSIFRKN